MDDDKGYIFKVNVPDETGNRTPERGLRGRSFSVTALLITAAVLACVMTAAALFLNSPKQTVLAGIRKLTASGSTGSVGDLPDEIIYGRTYYKYSLNVSNTEEWPVTVGIDGTAVRDGKVRKCSADAAVSVSNTHIADAVLYADGDSVQLQLPDLCRDVFTISPQHIGKKFNTSQLAFMTGTELDDFSLELFQQGTAEENDRDTDLKGLSDRIAGGMNVGGKTDKRDGLKICSVTMNDDAWKAVNELCGLEQKKASPEETYGLTFSKPSGDIQIAMKGRTVRQIALPAVRVSDTDGYTCDISGLSAGFDGSGCKLDTDGLTVRYKDGKVCKITGSVSVRRATDSEKTECPDGSRVSLFDLDIPEIYAYEDRFESASGLIREMMR